MDREQELIDANFWWSYFWNGFVSPGRCLSGVSFVLQELERIGYRTLLTSNSVTLENRSIQLLQTKIDLGLMLMLF